MTVNRAALLSAILLAVTSWSAVEGRSKMMAPLFSYGFPQTRSGRATPPATPPSAAADPEQELLVAEAAPVQEESFLDKILDEEQMIMDAIKTLNIKTVEAAEKPRLPAPAKPAKQKLFSPRRVEDQMNQFGPNMNRLQAEDDQIAVDSFPQINGRQAAAGAVAGTDDDVRCIPKVMQIEEIVYDRAIKCHHSYQEKCHLTYITDYQSTSEEKCETTFKKNCHITFKPMPFNETVSICNTPIERSCGTEAVGPDICSTQYETNCETRYNTYEIEQDEPVCTMELMKKCKNVTVSVPRARRQAEETTLAPESDTSTDDSVTEAPPGGDDGETLTFDQKCEEWPVQKCTLEKKMVKKVHPDTACKKIPREVCVPNNCETVQGKEICYDEVRMQVQNVPQEECELQPEETCHMESVLVPRLVPQPNCVKVPKEICVNTKTNPRKVKKPIVKEWCYKPSDLAANGGTA